MKISKLLGELPETVEIAVYIRGSVALEYRFRDRWVIAAGMAVGVEPKGSAPWRVSFPVRAGVIWW